MLSENTISDRGANDLVAAILEQLLQVDGIG
jgi:hypothetical protein